MVIKWKKNENTEMQMDNICLLSQSFRCRSSANVAVVDHVGAERLTEAEPT